MPALQYHCHPQREEALHGNQEIRHEDRLPRFKDGRVDQKANVKKHPQSTETEHRPIGKKPKRK